MQEYLAKRLLLTIPTLIGVSIIIFSLVRLIPGCPAVAIIGPHGSPEFVEQLREDMALDRSLPEQYGIFMRDILSGDLGTSSYHRRPVADLIVERFPRTLELALAGLLVASVIGVTMGVVSAVKRYTVFDYISMVIALFGVATPIFWLAMLLQLLFSVNLGWLPSTGSGTLMHLILPAIAIGAFSAGLIARITRSSMLEVLQQDYIVTARSKGLIERIVINRHALKNALIPVITIMGIQFGQSLGGSVLAETVFAWPGVGRLLVDSIHVRDYPTVQGVVLVFSFSFVLINILIDILYAFIDPRIRY